MTIYAGQNVNARMLNRLRAEPVSAAGTSDLTVTGTTTLVPGCEITVTVETAGAFIVADGSINFLVGGVALAASSYCSAQLVLDGATMPGFARWGDVAIGAQGTPSKQWKLTGLSAGNHTIRLAAARTSAGTGTVTAVGANSQLMLWLYEPVV